MKRENEIIKYSKPKKAEKKRQKKKQVTKAMNIKITNMVDHSPTISIIILNVNCLNISIKRD